MKLEITYNNNNEITQEIDYIRIVENKIFYTMKKNPAPAIPDIIAIPLENVKNICIY